MRNYLTGYFLISVAFCGCLHDSGLSDLGAEEEDVSTPLFIRTPIVASVDVEADAYYATTVLYIATTKTLIERILWCNKIEPNVATLAGYIGVGVKDPDGDDPANYHMARYIPVPAWNPSSEGYPLCGEIQLDLALDEGWGLFIFHTVTRSGPVDSELSFIVQGGELG